MGEVFLVSVEAGAGGRVFAGLGFRWRRQGSIR